VATLFGYDSMFGRHITGPHPECPQRLDSIVAALQREGLAGQLLPVKERVEPIRWIELVHTVEYIKRLEQHCREEMPYIDSPECTICPESYAAACEAVSVTLAACDMIMKGQATNGFCALRPPGHHAENNKSMGFCLFNNVAIACRYLQKQYGLKRVLILDWDVHHGNGTQHTFEQESDVFYCSLHQNPATLFPGTGWPQETGCGAGAGYTLNLILEPGTDDDDYMKVFNEEFVPAACAFKPEFILISAGFDGHCLDPLADLSLTERSYKLMTKETKALAEQYCQGRILSVLEGGYNLEVMASCVAEHIKVLMK